MGDRLFGMGDGEVVREAPFEGAMNLVFVMVLRVSWCFFLGGLLKRIFFDMMVCSV